MTINQKRINGNEWKMNKKLMKTETKIQKKKKDKRKENENVMTINEKLMKN